MKKRILAFLMLIISIFTFTSCGANNSNDKYKIVCTTFPQYDWVREIIKGNEDKFELTLLLDNKVDLHNYQPSAKDIVTIKNSDLFIYIGGDSDAWADDIITSDINALKLIDKLDKNKLLEINHEHEEEHEHTEECAYDEHIWLSLKNATILIEEIKKEISKLDSVTNYEETTKNYITKLNDLDTNFSSLKFSKDTVVFADRFPFSYLLHDYNIHHVAAFSGCSADSEVDFSVVTKLIKAVNENNLKHIVILEKTSNDLAKTVISETNTKNQEILEMNSMQSVDINSSYYDLMNKNLNVLKTVLE